MPVKKRWRDKKITLTGGGGSGERHFGRPTTGRRSVVSQFDAALGGGVRRVEEDIGERPAA
jgi:hypothetical protein